MNPIEALGLKELVLRLTIAAITGSILGLNRELHGKAAGLRTHALVALGASIVALCLPYKYKTIRLELKLTR